MKDKITLGSLFDGVGTWLLSAKHNDIQPLWGSEIDDFPAAVSHYHFPEVKQYGDVTKINGANLEPVDILCSGSPCQSFSVAGTRKGLDGQSGLFYESMRIFREMRKATNGKYPRFFVWENVTGVFSSNKGYDFRAVLEEITQTEIPFPKCKWSQSGMVTSKQCDIVWRTLDAQYWGIPQRRKRIFLVADFAERNRCAEQILFDEKSL